VQNAKTIECKANRLHPGDTVAVVARVAAYRIDETKRIKVGHELKLVEIWFLEKRPDSNKKTGANLKSPRKPKRPGEAAKFEGVC
jgi:hypothetical protein